MTLSQHTISQITTTAVQVPDEAMFRLPEKVLQFGTGTLLRGLPGYFIHKANSIGIFNGRIVVVKSTSGDTEAFHNQDCLYTVCVRGMEEGKPVSENTINASISRVLKASDEWPLVLACAHNPEMKIIVSNTTEVGIELVHEDIRLHPPRSFPGKLLSFLYERFKAFGGSAQSGMVIIPTELITDNGHKLEAIVFELAHLNSLEDAFIEWLEGCNTFCNSLVDRLVPGQPDAEKQAMLEGELGYKDKLLIMAEAYRLWAIEGDENMSKVLGFAEADKGIVITTDIEQYRELKLRMLNATHSFTCGLSLLAGCRTVLQSMQDERLASYISALMLEEISPSIPMDIKREIREAYAQRVLARFQNPDLQHKWLSIALNYSSKIKTRCVPLIQKHVEQYGTIPELMTLGFAAYLCFTRPVVTKGTQYYGELNGELYPLSDTEAAGFYNRWAGLSRPAFVSQVLSDDLLWGTDLSRLPGFADAVLDKLNLLLEGNVKEAFPMTRRA